jgi:peroxiredoxin
MPQVQLEAEAPDFTLEDYRGEKVSLSDFRGKKHVLLVLNRGFM